MNYWFFLFPVGTNFDLIMQEAMLKEELRNMERKLKREGVDMTYLKNVVVKLLETGARNDHISKTSSNFSYLMILISNKFLLYR